MEDTGAIVSWFVLAAEFYRFNYMTKQTEEEVNAVFNVWQICCRVSALHASGTQEQSKPKVPT